MEKGTVLNLPKTKKINFLFKGRGKNNICTSFNIHDTLDMEF